MTDWMRFFSPLDLALFLLSALGWAAGGWLLVRGLFRPRQHERLLVGIAVGWVLHLLLTNLLVQVLPMLWANLLSAALLLGAGLALHFLQSPKKQQKDGHSERSEESRVDETRPFANAQGDNFTSKVISPEGRLSQDLRAWPQLVALALLTLLFESALRGFSLFDEYLHLPLVSIMGAGDIPPHFYGDANLPFAYHYGLHIFAALLTRLANFYPYTAWDLARGFSIALTAVLGWLWVRRFTRSALAGTLGSLLITLGGGTRWLLLLLPASALNWISAGVQMSNTGLDTGANLVEALSRPWHAEGLGDMPLPFAFLNGTFSPQSFAIGAASALPAVIVLLLLLLSKPGPSLKNPGGLAVLAFLLAGLALSAEHLYAMLWVGVWLALLIAWLRQKRRLEPGWLAGWAVILLGSALLSAVQGGYITVTLQSWLARLAGTAAASSYVYGFGLRWPPAVVTGHLGNLNPLDPRQLAALLAELGPALLLAPLACRLAWRAARRQDGLSAGLGFAALLALAFTLFVQYGLDRQSSRFAGTTLWLWLALCAPLLWHLYKRGGQLLRAALGAGFGAAILSGVVIFALQATSITVPRASYYLEVVDQAAVRAYWNKLPADAHVLDNRAERSVAIFGRAAYAFTQEHAPLPQWGALVDDPTPAKVLAAGYTHLYMNNFWWNNIPTQTRQALQAACVQAWPVIEAAGGLDYRQVLDVTGCR